MRYGQFFTDREWEYMSNREINPSALLSDRFFDKYFSFGYKDWMIERLYEVKLLTKNMTKFKG